MPRPIPPALLSLALAAVSLTPHPQLAAEDASRKGMVATVHPLATEAAVDVLNGGGNAVDAAVCAALVLGVVDNHNSGIGGGCFILIRTADGSLVAIDGRETAPAKAHRDMYLRDGKADADLSQTGPLAVGTPGALAAYQLAVARHGKKQLPELLRPGQEFAEDGFAIDAAYARKLAAEAETLARFEGSRGALLKTDGAPYREGETLRQADLARTYREIAARGTDWFYRGEFAERVGRWMEENGGILSAEDFAAYEAKLREPVITTYREHTVAGFPPPSSGGIHVAQILNILEQFDVKDIRRESRADFIHLLAEAMKPVFADRAFWLGDADFAQVPRGLIDKDYARRLAKGIDLSKAAAVAEHGRPPAEAGYFEKHTTHIAAADAEGNWVAITATVNTTFGSKVIVPGTGVVLNNEMDDFSIAPGVPNAFGLIGAEANAVAPGKRPLSSMSPTIVLKDGRPVMTLGAAGGPTIITQVVLGIVRRLDLGMSLEQALAAPRFHHQWSPDELTVESSLPDEVIAELEAKGHRVTKRKSIGVSQAILQSEDGGFAGAHDPRVSGKAAGP